MSLVRQMEPEWLDELPPDDPQAVRSRRDLVRVNWLMRNDAALATLLREAFGNTAPTVVADLGTGDGRLLLRVAQRLKNWSGVRLLLIDQVNIIAPETIAEFARLGWQAEPVTTDIMRWLMTRNDGEVDVMLANLFLHHLTENQLIALFQYAGRIARCLVAAEPRRAWLPLYGSHLLGLIGCNKVTRHDAVVSVKAGFNDRELSALWRTPGWELQERYMLPFSHGFRACRTPAPATTMS